ncbi:hypothetical protein QUV83_16195 [Cellulomonas cellasea]|uniref:hypothetical protein n=1 Tax=Cellulomonas cellasea TaxID=43670 RepID=UPI0025A3818C|nr:hypothetical protein [Cellulomonas cellasea]MDM8086316.1 hypothetical protein [Cellulomonas cellasea]
MKALMKLKDAAAETPYDEKTLRKAIRATDPTVFPPPLRAKTGSRGEYLITDTALREWIDSLADA